MNKITSQRRAFTLVEILVVLAVVSLLAAILFPVVSRARANARTSTCTANLRQIGQALSLYISDNDGFYPSCATNKDTDKGRKFSSVWWMNIGLKPPPVCPEVDFGLWKSQPIMKRMGSYSCNLRLNRVSGSQTKRIAVGKGESVLRYPSFTVVAFDSRPLISAMIGPDTMRTKNELWFSAVHPPNWADTILQFPPGATRHQGGANYLFGDGHVKWYRPEQLSTTRKNDGINPGFGL